ncbi:uncharacterized protein PITG_19104 [Phytophthora infestans T30-4]|uniref:Uncharacterized protein n=1 Tax=Phytophthora infestans (strain T30-4) TaxID=403677 RepID=D0NYU6_PHYIT|nr:uncharacterized protein PITG_19104 [Phytophthora infestans T30-4]EEY68729.1 conserved hypothetical protein [Phytophthora infestans T30-4]|eukprot:XP_002997421.1 conserved hypothetical protein [Phytophthora infestans T30-4]
MAPTSRPPVLSLLSTNAASQLFNDFLVKYPDLNFLKSLELLVFMTGGGWIFSAGFFYPESYERSHMTQILKSVVLKQDVAHELQELYRKCLNPNPCNIRHKGLSCGQYARSDFLLRVVIMAWRLYAPVHLTTWILSQRHAKVRLRPAVTQLKGFLKKMTRSSAFSIGAGNVATRKIPLLQPGVSSIAVSIILMYAVQPTELELKPLKSTVKAKL